MSDENRKGKTRKDERARVIVGLATALLVAGAFAGSGIATGKDNSNKGDLTPRQTVIMMAVDCLHLSCASSQWVEIESFSWGVEVPLDGPNGMATGAPKLSEVAITKFVDKLSHDLMTDAVQGRHIRNVDFGFYNTKGGSGQAYLKITLSDVLVSKFHLDATHGFQPPSEDVAFTFKKIEWTHVVGNATVVDEWEAPASA